MHNDNISQRSITIKAVVVLKVYHFLKKQTLRKAKNILSYRNNIVNNIIRFLTIVIFLRGLYTASVPDFSVSRNISWFPPRALRSPRKNCFIQVSTIP